MWNFLYILAFVTLENSNAREYSRKREEKSYQARSYQDITETTTKLSDPAAVRSIANGNAEFGQKLYESMRKVKGARNLVMSPYSVSSAMAMATLGAKGKTLEEMREGMVFPKEEKVLVAGYNNAFRVLRGNKNFTLETANKLFVQEGYKLMKGFVKVMKESFYANATQTDFAASKVARKLINDWVKLQTKKKIKKLIPKGFLDSKTKLLLVNAIYFKGNWSHQFNKELTADSDFYVKEGKEVKAKMMKIKQTYKVADFPKLNAQAIELPYKGDRVSMYILLPNKNFSLSDVETRLSKTKLHKLFTKVDDAGTHSINLFLPKFKLEKTIKLKNHLKKLGMVKMFDPTANFSGISGKTDLYVLDVIQKAFIEINEEGAEAAASTAIKMGWESAVESQPFICDHPFIFFIKDKLTDMVLFTGRVMDPTA